MNGAAASSNGNGDSRVKALAESAYLQAGARIASLTAAPVVIYLLTALLTLRTDVTELQGNVKRIDESMGLRTQLRYTSVDAERDRAAIDFRFDAIEHRLDQVEGRK